MQNNFRKRIGAALTLVFALFLLPWWLCSLLAACYVLYFQDPYEVFGYGILLDGLYGVVQSNFFFTHIFFIGTAVFLFASLWIKEHLMFNR